MRVRALSLFAFAFALSVSAQENPATGHVFYFSAGDSAKTIQETVNAIRTLIGSTQTSLAPDTRRLTIQASPSDMALAQWIFQELEAPVPVLRETQADSYPGPALATDRVRIFRLAHVNSVHSFNEIVNAVRTIPEITRAFPYSSTWSIAVRGTQNQVDAAEWLARQLDQPAPSPGQRRAEQQLHIDERYGPELRVLYFSHVATLQGRQEVTNALRVIPRVTKVFPANDIGAIAIRESAGAVSLAEWLFTQLDVAGPPPAAKSSAAQPVTPGTDLAQVFFLPPSTTAQSFQDTANSIRGSTQAPVVFPCASSNALVFRGSAQQLTQAVSILKAAAMF